MKIFSEKKAENFLEKEGFKIIERTSLNKISQIDNSLKKIKFPFVMKVSGEKIIHKNKKGGVRLNIKDKTEFIKNFKELKKIKGYQEIIIQKQINGKEFLLGIKKTPEFKHVLVFGYGGIHVEKLKKVTFRVYPLNSKEIKEMIKEIVPKLSKNEIEMIEKNLMKLCTLIKKYPKITELDINPLMVSENDAIIVDARIVFE